jgi:dipeptidyl aminopeptidase/acylaminoacyl peptidase
MTAIRRLVPVRRRGLAAAALAVTAAAGLLAIGLSSPARASYPGSDGVIAFVQGGNIWTITPAGTDLTRLTSDGHDSGPRWSPDGDQLAYLDRGNLWIMNADGSGRHQVTTASPRYTDARPSWSPNGHYLAFVRTQRGHSFGYLMRYALATGRFVTFSTPYRSEGPTRRQVKVTALPAPVAWAWAANGTEFGSFVLYEGVGGDFCRAHYYCLDALGRPHQDMYRNAFPSAEDQTRAPVKLLDPDWFPDDPQFDTQVVTTQESCSAGRCTDTGIDLGIGASPVLPGAYQAVYSPVGRQIAYVQKVSGVPEIFLADNVASPKGTMLTAGSQPDWQPRPVT